MHTRIAVSTLRILAPGRQRASANSQGELFIDSGGAAVVDACAAVDTVAAGPEEEGRGINLETNGRLTLSHSALGAVVLRP